MRSKCSPVHTYILLASVACVLGGAGTAYAQTAPATPSAATPSTSAADSQLQDIVVTARRVSENVQKVPTSIGILNSEQLNDRQILSVIDLKSSIVGLNTFRTGTAASSTLSIRGYSGEALPTPAGDSGVGVYLDGVYLARGPGNGADIVDLAQVDVLRGPQGTLFGRNSDGGAINFITNNPNFSKTEIKLDALYGNYNHFRGSAIVNVPISDTLAVRAAYQHNQEDGDVKNTATTGDIIVNNGLPGSLNATRTASPPKTLGSTNSDAYTGKVRWTGVEGLTVDFKYDYERFKEEPTPTQVIGYLPSAFSSTLASLAPYQAPGATPQSFTRLGSVNEGFQGPSNVNNSGELLTLQYALGDHITLKNISAWRKTHSTSTEDLDGSNWQVPIPPTYAFEAFCVSCSINDLRQSQFTQEDQIIGKFDKFNFVAGAYYFIENSSFIEEYFTGGVFAYAPVVNTAYTGAYEGQAPGPYTLGELGLYRNRSYAGYAHGDYILTDQFKLSAGIRYTADKRHTQDLRSFAAGDGNYNTNTGEVTYDAALNYQIDSDKLIYARYATGFNAGGVLGSIVFKPEKSKQAELGAKTEFLDRRLRINAAIYYTWINNKQQALPNLSATTSPELAAAGYTAPYPLGIFIYNQPGTGTIKGLEFESILVPVRGLTLSGNVSYNDPHNTDGSLNNSPKTTLNFAGDYDFTRFSNNSFVKFHMDADYRSGYYGSGATNLGVYSNSGPYGPVPDALMPAAYAGNSAGYLAALQKAAVLGHYWLANARLSLNDFSISGHTASITGFVQNMFNSKGQIFNADYGFSINGAFERPRTYGVEIRLAL